MTSRCLSMIAAGLLLAFTANAAWAVNKCVDADGNISFQDQPCPEGVDAAVIDTRTGLAVSPPLPEVGEGPDADDESEDEAILELVSVQATYEGCNNVSDGFADRHGALLAQWKTANAMVLARYGNSGRYRQLLERGLERMRLGAAGNARTQLATFCEGQFVTALAQTQGD